MPKLNQNVEFIRGQYVYLTHDPEKIRRQITAIIITMNGIMYRLSAGETETENYEAEIIDKLPVEDI